jgi:hypothetical protein
MRLDDRVRGEGGFALVLTIMAMLLLSSLVAAMVLWTSSESLIAASFRGGREAFYAAEAVAEWTTAELATVADEWTAVANGLQSSSFADGLPAGPRMVAGEAVVDLTDLVAANPGWRLFAYGPLASLGSSASQVYIASLVAPDPAGGDGLRVRALAFGPRGAGRTLELGVFRSPRGVHVSSWAELP